MSPRILALAASFACGAAWAQDPPPPAVPAPTPGALRAELVAAIRAGDAAQVGALLEAGADPQAPDSLGQDPLMVAALIGEVSIIERLLMHHANAWAACYNQGLTALMLAAGRGHVDAVRLLLQWGVPPDMRDGFGNTALMLAANNGRQETVSALLAAGAAATLRNRAGETARAMALRNGQTEIAQMMPADPPAPAPVKLAKRRAPSTRRAAAARRAAVSRGRQQ